MTSRDAYFEQLYRNDDDPYQLRTRWYEARKRAVLLSALPAPRFGSAYEPGCGVGELTAALAERCAHLLASDFQPAAVARARHRTRQWDHVEVVQQRLPADWPIAAEDEHDPSRGPFDLIVLSEIGYFLQPAEMTTVATRCRASLAAGGTLVACDWLHDFRERTMPTAAVHGFLGDLGLTRLVMHEEPDFLLQVWSDNPCSVADREQIR